MVRLFKLQGITMIELLIAALLTTIIASAGLSFYIRANQQYISQENISDTQQNARASIQEICREIRMAGFNIPDSVNAYQIMSVADNPDTLTINRDTLSIRYYIDEADTLHPQLIRELDGTPTIFADDIHGFEVTVIAANKIQVVITSKSAKTDDQILGGDKFCRTFTQVIGLRNVN
jgi:biotin operon repressor